jgi:hypothetical protein
MSDERNYPGPRSWPEDRDRRDQEGYRFHYPRRRSVEDQMDRRRHGQDEYENPNLGHDYGREDGGNDRFSRPRARPPQGSADYDRLEQGPGFGEGSRMGYGTPGGKSEEAQRRSSYSLRGPFVGRGPKGYSRSDERIREDACEVLTQHPEIDASNLEVSVQAGEITLTGTVPDRSMKRMAEEAVEYLSGVRDVVNQIRVKAAA